MWGKAVEYPQKIFAGHVGNGVGNAVAAAVLTMQIAAQRALPEKIRQRVRLDFVMAIKAERFERKLFLEAELHFLVIRVCNFV